MHTQPYRKPDQLIERHRAELLADLTTYKNHLLIKKDRSALTAKQYASDIASFLASGMTAAGWLERPNERDGGVVSAAGFNARRARMVAYFNWKRWFIEDLPDAHKKEYSDWEILSPDQVLEWIGAAQQTMSYREQAAMTLLYSTGVRRAELLGARLADLEFGKDEHGHEIGALLVKGKGRKHRMVAFGKTAARLLQAYLRFERAQRVVRDSAKDRIFVGDRGACYSPEVIVPAVRKAAELAGLDKVAKCQNPVHMFRRCCLTHSAENGASPWDIQEMAGHASVAESRHYVKLSRKLNHQKYAKFHPLAALEAEPAVKERIG